MTASRVSLMRRSRRLCRELGQVGDRVPETRRRHLAGDQMSCACGCGRQVTSHRFRYVRGHNSVPRKGYTTNENGCWIWNGHIKASGYPGNAYGNTQAHRAMFIKARGPIPNGMHLDHLCRTPSCVNPSHLEIVTPAENLRRAPTSRYSADLKRRVFDLRAEGQSQSAISRAVSLSRPMVSRIISGQRWGAL